MGNRAGRPPWCCPHTLLAQTSAAWLDPPWHHESWAVLSPAWQPHALHSHGGLQACHGAQMAHGAHALRAGQLLQPTAHAGALVPSSCSAFTSPQTERAGAQVQLGQPSVQTELGFGLVPLKSCQDATSLPETEWGHRGACPGSLGIAPRSLNPHSTLYCIPACSEGSGKSEITVRETLACKPNACRS